MSKNFFDMLSKFSETRRSGKLMIKNERHPSWVSFVTIFLPVPNTAPVPPAPAAAGATPEAPPNHAPT